ncbi:hypothetical protein CVD28_01720 [Bacillus sp. M6-12]|uniref:hypothetical protein n=1 Tax=Bacillus sp. M6-12 TaxID=2054166 RepID=UPI000C76EC60|nr:hypothetical protein [Bacillus sp. M6-12]PLS19152.1 hypothetical protein CVD28_01720 [Bacillus sp. M6-12]
MKKDELRKSLLERGGNGRTLMELQAETGLEYFKVPFEDVEYIGTVIVKVEEGLLEIPYRMVDIEGSLEEFVVGAEQLINEERIREIERIYASQQGQFMGFCQPKKIINYMQLAEELFTQYKNKGVHFKDIWRHLEKEEKCKGIEQDILESIELYIRYNLYDNSLKDKDIDDAKEHLKSQC